MSDECCARVRHEMQDEIELIEKENQKLKERVGELERLIKRWLHACSPSDIISCEERAKSILENKDGA